MIKSYSDLEQSKRLAKILPLESADMWYQHTGISIKDGSQKPIYFPMVIRDCESDEDIPCWSLAALLNIIQKTTPYKMEHFGDKKVQLVCVLGDKPWELVISDFNNEVDACVEIVLKLHEEDLL